MHTDLHSMRKEFLLTGCAYSPPTIVPEHPGVQLNCFHIASNECLHGLQRLPRAADPMAVVRHYGFENEEKYSSKLHRQRDEGHKALDHFLTRTLPTCKG